MFEALQVGLQVGASAGAGSRLDYLVVVHSEGSGIVGVGRKIGDAVANESVDAANCLGIDVVGLLVQLLVDLS